MPGDLPDVQTMKERGITRIVYVVESLDDAEVEEDDLHASFRAWQSAGLTIYLVDLAFLKQVGPAGGAMFAADWAPRLSPYSYYVRDRYTLVDEPRFYARARGGFGLARGRPFITPGYRSYWYWGGGYRGGGGGGSGGGGSGGGGSGG